MLKNGRAIGLLIGACLVSNVVTADYQTGGTLRVPIINTGFVENYNPYTTKDLLHGVMFEPLFMYNNMTGETDYRLAETVEYSEDLKRLTIKLKPGLKWSDGKALSAKDVAFSFNLVKSVPAFDVKGIWSKGQLKKVTQLDDRSIELELHQADANMIWNLPHYHILPQHTWAGQDNYPTFTNADNPVGNGPMTEVSYNKPQQMQLCRNPNYYLKGLPYLDCIQYKSFNDNSQIQPALMKGQIDWGSNFIADVEKTFVAKDKENHHIWYPPNDAVHFYINTKKKPFDNLAVRQALSMAIDREAIVDIAAYGYPTVNFNMGGLGELYKDSISEEVRKEFGYLSEYNPEAAKALLDQAGLIDRDGDGVRETPEGRPLAFDIQVVNGWTDWIQVVQMAGEYYAEIGIQANLKTVDWGVYDKALKQGDYEVAINWSLAAPNPIKVYEEYFASSRIGKAFHAGHGFHNPMLDALIQDFGTLRDSQKQHDILNKLQRVTAENLPFIPLFSNPTWFQFNTSNIVGWPSEEDPYVHPVWYDGGKRVVLLNRLHLK
ncbi:ABC-type dipeptide transport system, periplasmic component [Marinomonas sp. MED121]|uniref:ABC transporter substrate-binding protein n=1 Tax=Marinomonas sp. MED121 TaxID=314277 RepID=UPI000068FB28|nr:ABC transporter substrate-binding protein [Marinomonas sp. MED121]EAQ65108.1 ABC-type dipeptide transport system, periplasmic component [Marinomonas sp. MED121]